jgi:hypothetical protein
MRLLRKKKRLGRGKQMNGVVLTRDEMEGRTSFWVVEEGWAGCMEECDRFSQTS